MNKFYLLSAAVLIFLLQGCNDGNTNTQTATNTVTVNADTVKSDVPKTDAEVALEAVKLGLEVTKDVIDNKRVNDSIKEAHKEKMYAYQIGLEKTDKDEVFDTYKKLLDLNVSGLYVLKKSRKDYIIVKYESKPQGELTQALDALKAQIASVESRVDITNLMRICGASEIIKNGGKLKERKMDFEIPCLICN